jgi:pilus assembly protein CpaC
MPKMDTNPMVKQGGRNGSRRDRAANVPGPFDGFNGLDGFDGFDKLTASKPTAGKLTAGKLGTGLLRHSAVILAAVTGLASTAAAQTRPAAAPAQVAAPAPTTAPAMPAASDNSGDFIEGLAPDGKLHLLVGRSVVLKTRTPYKRVSVSNPEILADNEVDATGILVRGNSAGKTWIILWDDHDHNHVVEVLVDYDLPGIRALLKQEFPEADILPTSANDAIVLKGRVPTLAIAEQATDMVGHYGKVLNFMQISGGQQVMLKVRFAEISRTAESQLGFNIDIQDGKSVFGFGNGLGGSGIGQLNTNAGVGTAVSSSIALFGGGSIGRTSFEAFLTALRSNNLIRLLAEPNLVTSSGQEANFLAGGEIPIPVPQAGSSGAAAITIEYKDYGVRLAFVPVVLGDGKIRLKVSPEVSQLDYSNAVTFDGFSIPALTKRNLSTTVELKDGQTLALAGLLQTNTNATKSVTPLLGDAPVLGALFRSVSYQRQETELVVLVTPEVVDAMNPSEVPDLPGEHWTVPTENDLFLFQDLGGPGGAHVRHPASQELKPGPARYFGPYGFNPVER